MTEFEEQLKSFNSKLGLRDINPTTWLKIENEILKAQNKQKAKIITWITASAAVIVLLLIASINYSGSKVSAEAVLANYGLNEYNYPELIMAKTGMLSAMEIPQESMLDFQILIDQLKFLDTQYQSYLEYINQNGYQEFLSENIQNYYEMKINLLDKIHAEIEKLKAYETDSEKYLPLDMRL